MKQTTRIKKVNEIGDTTSPATSANQELLIAGLITNDAFNGYGLYGVEDDGTNTYVASQNASGKWIIMRIVNATGLATYASGDTDAATNWTNRASLTYEDYATEF